jgi:hypothetical protein
LRISAVGSALGADFYFLDVLKRVEGRDKPPSQAWFWFWLVSDYKSGVNFSVVFSGTRPGTEIPYSRLL